MIFCRAMEGLSGRIRSAKAAFFWCAKIEKLPLDFQGAMVIMHSLFCAQQGGVFPRGHTESALKQGDKMGLGGETQPVTHLLGGAALPKQGFG